MSWRLGVAGFPIEHSLSPRLHEVGLTLAGLEGTSTRLELREHEAPRLAELMGSRFDALSVTMPLKFAAPMVCDWLDEVSLRTGVVNSLLARDGQILGACTDGLGFVGALRAEFAVSLEGARTVVLGSGGAARGIVDALVHAGVESVSVYARTAANAAVLVDRYDNVFDHASPPTEIDLIVNTTPSATRTDEDHVLEGTGVATVAVDITYEPRMSRWRALYEQIGCRSTNGLGMLAYQAALQMEWWWDTKIDAAVLLGAIS
jgi:shikimate dehydrogenase